MLFAEKADYTGIHDDAGVPLLDYRGKIGPQYNPIAIAQWGLANFNRYVSARDATARKKFLSASDWLRDNLERNSANIPVWQHHFDWDYRDTLRAPWYSGLAQGQGISLLLRAAAASGKNDYLDAARSAFESLSRTSAEGGVLFVDEFQDVWIEEYIVTPPTHILNGFIWAVWGVYDYSLTFPTSQARDLFNRCVETLTKNLARYDNGFWSLYAVGNQTPDGGQPLLSSASYRAAARHASTHKLGGICPDCRSLGRIFAQSVEPSPCACSQEHFQVVLLLKTR